MIALCIKNEMQVGQKYYRAHKNGAGSHSNRCQLPATAGQYDARPKHGKHTYSRNAL